MPKQYKLKNYKFTLILLVVILNIIGILLVGSASPGDQQKQLIGMLSGLLIMAAVSCIDYSFLLRFSWVIYMFAVALLVFVFVAGDDAGGAQRWFEIGGFRFQPSELVKICVILFFAYYFMKHEEKISSLPVLCRSFLLIGIILALIIAQPNLSTTIIMALIFCAMLFIAGLSYKIVAGVLLTCVPAFLVFMTLVIQDTFRLSAPIRWGVSWHGNIRRIIRILPFSSRTPSWRSVRECSLERVLEIRTLHL